MRLFLLTTLTMIAFAANSVLNRLAIVDAGMDAIIFGGLRLFYGAVMLAVLLVFARRGFAFGGKTRVVGVAALLLYIFGFSLAYRGLDAGAGALILFGMVQITMFGGALAAGERVPLNRWAGAALAFFGLTWLLWPGAEQTMPALAALAMAAGGIGWGIYSLAGRHEADPLQGTAMNFLLAAPLGLLLILVGLALVTGAFSTFSYWLLEHFPALATLG